MTSYANQYTQQVYETDTSASYYFYLAVYMRE